MKKDNSFKALLVCCTLVVTVLWLLGECGVLEFETRWLLASLFWAFAVLFILRGIFANIMSQIKRLFIFIGVLFFVAGMLVLIGILANNIILPIIAVGICVVLLAVLYFGNGEKWDKADNEDEDYKDYNHRK